MLPSSRAGRAQGQNGYMVCRIVIAMMVLIGCGSSESREPDADLALVHSFVLEESDSLFLGHFWTITVTTSPHRVYVPDAIADQVGVYDSLGSIVRFFGSSGEGPGELEGPDKVLVQGSTVYVIEDDRYSVFDTSGTFRRVMHFPEGVYRDDQWSMGYYNDRLVIPATDISKRSGHSFRRTLDEPTIAFVDTLFDEVNFMGQYPAFYREGEYVDDLRSVDVRPNGLMAVSYQLLSIVDLYDLAQAELLPARTIQMDHPNWKQVAVEMPPSMPIPEIDKLFHSTSTTIAAYIVKDEFVVLYFMNASPDYQVGDDRTSDHFAAVATIDGEQVAALTLPGPILARDERDLLYIRLSSVPDEREIGVYDLVVQ